MEEEKPVWQGNPSQLLNLHIFLMCLLLGGVLLFGAIYFRQNLSAPWPYVIGGLALIPFGVALARYLQTKFWRYELTSERLRIRQGVFSRRTDEIELYRVKDYVLSEPFALRMFGLGDIVLTTTDDANRTVLLKAVRRPTSLRDEIRRHVRGSPPGQRRADYGDGVGRSAGVLARSTVETEFRRPVFISSSC
jgi:uncharacterized membrane protein YdbT with pleckstrin-like domain